MSQEFAGEINQNLKTVAELKPAEILDQINQMLAFQFADGSRKLSIEEINKLSETQQIVDQVLKSREIQTSVRFQNHHRQYYNLDILSGVVSFEGRSVCQLTKNEKAFLFGLILKPGEVVSKSDLNKIIYSEQVAIPEIMYQDNRRLQLLKSRVVKKLGKDLSPCLKTVLGQGYTWLINSDNK